MEENATERFEMDLEQSKTYLRQIPARIQHERARTANSVAIILIAGVVFSLPAYIFAAWMRPDQIEISRAIFDRWYATIGPLVGTAIGAYYGSRFSSGASK